MKKLFYLLLTVFSISTTHAQQPQPFDVHDTRTRDAYVADLHILADSIFTYHPQPFAFITEPDFRALIAQKEALLTDATTISEFAWICRSIAAAVGCGHTHVYYQYNIKQEPSMYFPMVVSYVGDRLYVIDPLNNGDKLRAGTELLSVNGISATELRQRLRKHIPTDGYNISMTDRLINNEFYRLCAYQLGFPSVYSVVTMDHGAQKEIQLSPAAKEPLRPSHLDKCPENLCFSIDKEHSLATITIRSFVYYGDNFTTFQSFIDSCFAQIEQQGIQHLALDLRNNFGGDPYCASYLLQHLANKSYQYYRTGTSLAYTDLQQEIKPLPERFTGSLYVLTNGLCFSTTGHLCALMKDRNIGTFIGQETGGTYTCNAHNRNITLKNTGLFATTATETYKADVAYMDKARGVLPHYPTTYSLQDILSDRDLEMEKVYQLIAE